MKYLCLIYVDEEEAERLADRELRALEHEHLEYHDTLRRKGHFIAAEALQPVESSTTIRVRNGKLSVTDGPFMETREQMGGLFLIEARDLNEAILVASKIPCARLGTVEVRPVRELQAV
ncbi:MAG: YciI family protein [Gemmatimonadales bacterium]